MSPSERSRSQPAHDTESDNVPVLLPPPLRPLAPKPTPRFRPLAIRGSSDSLFASAQGQQSDPNRGRLDNRCAVCFKRECSLVSHKLHNGSSSLQHQRPLVTLQVPLPQDSFAASYSVRIAALYDGSSLGSTNPNVLDQLPIPPDLDQSHMHQLFHTCKYRFCLSSASCSTFANTKNRVCGGGTQSFHCPTTRKNQKRFAS